MLLGVLGQRLDLLEQLVEEEEGLGGQRLVEDLGIEVARLYGHLYLLDQQPQLTCAGWTTTTTTGLRWAGRAATRMQRTTASHGSAAHTHGHLLDEGGIEAATSPTRIILKTRIGAGRKTVAAGGIGHSTTTHGLHVAPAAAGIVWLKIVKKNYLRKP